jgi:hypothetical protein
MKINLKLELKIIAKALFKNVAKFGLHNLSDKEKAFVVSKMEDYDDIPDRIIAEDEVIQDAIVWDRISDKRVVRLITRNVYLMNIVDVLERNFTIADLLFFFKVHPEKIHSFNIDINSINHKDAYALFSLGQKFFLDIIDIKKYSFSSIEIFKIVKAYGCSNFILNLIDTNALCDYQTAEVMIENGPYLLDVKKLTPYLWVKVLTKRPEFIDLCDLNTFIESKTMYNTIQLVVIVKNRNLDYLMDNVDFSKLSSFELEKLIIHNPERFIPVCELGKLNDNNWKQILEKRPELQQIKDDIK